MKVILEEVSGLLTELVIFNESLAMNDKDITIWRTKSIAPILKWHLVLA